MTVPTYNQEHLERAKDVRRQLPGLVQTISRDLTKKLEWAPYLSAAPAAICVMATCLVAGSSPDTGSIEVNIPPLKVHGISIKPHKYLGANLQYCNDLGKRAFDQAERGMQALEDRAEFVVGATGPLAQIVSVLNDSQPQYSALNMWMKALGEAAATCQDEARVMKANFEALLQFIIELQRASIEALNANQQQLRQEQQATKDAVGRQYEEEIQQAENAKNRLQQELDEEKAMLKHAQEKRKTALKANPWEETQAQIDQINSELRNIDDEQSSWATAALGLFFGNAKKARKERDRRKQSLLDKRKQLLEERGKHIDDSQACAVDDMEACQKRVAEAEHRLLAAQGKHTALLKEQFQSVKHFENACQDLSMLSDTTLDLKAINDILLRSIKALKGLKKYIDKMTTFFIQVSRYVDDTMHVRLSQFKKQTGDVETGRGSRTVEENIRHKTLAIMTTLDLHGRFTLIHDIAGIYIKVSRNYIKPGMEKMDDLTFLDDDEYQEEMTSFKKWGNEAVEGINTLATVANVEIERTVFGGMASLVRQQISIDDQSDAEDSEDHQLTAISKFTDCAATTTWISTHGIGATKDSTSSFSITADKGSALVKPTNPNQLSGWIHFTIPSPSTNNPNLQVVALDFSSSSASVDTVAIYLANSVRFKEEGLQKRDSFHLEITGTQAVYKGKGISVSILVEFDSVNSNVKFQSIGIQV